MNALIRDPAERPSRPSVIFTAFAVDIIIIKIRGISHNPILINSPPNHIVCIPNLKYVKYTIITPDINCTN